MYFGKFISSKATKITRAGREEQKMEMRMISKESTNMVYHRPECRYALRINKKNWVQMDWDEARKQGYRPCKCCDEMRFLYGLEKENIECYSESHNLDIDLIKNEIIVRTDAGCWKILYKKSRQKFILLHRNYAKGRITLDEINKVPYHHQGDFPFSKSIMKYVRYIQAHDEFKLSPVDYRTMPQSTQRQRTYYRAAKRREEKRV